MLDTIKALPPDAQGSSLWHLLTTRVLRPTHPFAVHQLLARAVFGDDPHPPLWTPSSVEHTNLARFMRGAYAVRGTVHH